MRKLALSLAKEEHIENLEAVELAALLHGEELLSAVFEGNGIGKY